MTSRVFRLLFVVLLALSFGALSGSAHAVVRTVPKAECPSGSPGPSFVIPGCWNFLHDECTRTDEGIEETNPGFPVIVEGGTLNCENCDGCAEGNYPDPVPCKEELEVEYTELVEVTLADDGMDSAFSVTLALELSIGHRNQFWFARDRVWCGNEEFPGCDKQSFIAVMEVTEGIETEMTHKYHRTRCYRHRDLTLLEQAILATAQMSGVGNPTCSSCGESLGDLSILLANFTQLVHYTTNLPVGDTKSTATGSSFGDGKGMCEAGDVSECD